MTNDEIYKTAMSLDKHLRDIGVRGPVGIAHDKDGPRLIVYAELKKDEKQVPKDWNGLTVVTEVIGKILPAKS